MASGSEKKADESAGRLISRWPLVRVKLFGRCPRKFADDANELGKIAVLLADDVAGGVMQEACKGVEVEGGSWKWKWKWKCLKKSSSESKAKARRIGQVDINYAAVFRKPLSIRENQAQCCTE